MIVVGLTGSIAMGKSTTAAMFAEAGAAVFDADAAVHALYGPDGEAARAIADAFPGVVGPQGVDRGALGARVREDAEAFARLEAIVHPLVAAQRRRFLADAKAEGRVVAVLDIPLLFETGAEQSVDVVIVASAPAETQRERALARPGMTPEAFQAIVDRQLPDAEKRARADFVVDTGEGLEAARTQVARIMTQLTGRAAGRGTG